MPQAAPNGDTDVSTAEDYGHELSDLDEEELSRLLEGVTIDDKGGLLAHQSPAWQAKAVGKDVHSKRPVLLEVEQEPFPSKNVESAVQPTPRQNSLNVGHTSVSEIPAFTFSISSKLLHTAKNNLKEGELLYFAHEHYQSKDGSKVKVHYCKTLQESERVAKLFLEEKVIGFDMEWLSRPSTKLKDQISLMQVASATDIALFHIAQHEGESVNDIVAPTLRGIIETDQIMKVGNCILTADGARLKRCFAIEPRGLFELSHLYRIVKYAATRPSLVTKRAVKLAVQCEEHLGLPLRKDEVRVSDWRKPLTPKQASYAASDAYVGLVLFHTMDAKRLEIKPTPPMPAFAELCLPLLLSDEDEDEYLEGSVSVKLGQEEDTDEFTTLNALYPLLRDTPNSKSDARIAASDKAHRFDRATRANNVENIS